MRIPWNGITISLQFIHYLDMKAHRMARIAETVREVAAETILFEIKDPRVKMVTVTRAEVSGDMQHAKIFVSVMGTAKDAKLTLHGLASDRKSVV